MNLLNTAMLRRLQEARSRENCGHSKSLFALTIVVLQIFAVSSSLAATRPSQYEGQALHDLLEKFSGVEIQINTDKSVYLEGEFVYLTYIITCTESSSRPWGNTDILNCSILLRDGQRMDWMRSDWSHARRYPDSASVFVGNVQANGWFSDRSITSELGFRLLAPGNFVGYFDQGIVSQDFTFAVMAVPDSLLEHWDKYCLLRKIGEGSFRERGISTLDSLSSIMREFLNHPIGSPWRKEALDKGAFILGLASRSIPLRPEDTQSLADALAGLADEPGYPLEEVINTAMESLCRRETRAESYDALREFADRIGRADIREEIQKREMGKNRHIEER